MIVLGLGGNLGGDDAILARFSSVAGSFAALSRSRVYRTAPIGPEQPDFLNAAIAICWNEDVDSLVSAMHDTERRLGRDRASEQRWGPRPIDIDLLLWDDRVIHAPVEVPHPRLASRRFALAPLADLVGADAPIPGSHRLGDLLDAVLAQPVDVTDLTF